MQVFPMLTSDEIRSGRSADLGSDKDVDTPCLDVKFASGTVCSSDRHTHTAGTLCQQW